MSEKYLAPAPWTVSVDAIDADWLELVSVIDAKHREVCILTRGYEDDMNSPARTNAKLIAAAPDLLAALKALHDDCVEYARINNLHNSDGSQATHQALLMVRAAIAKATGDA